MENHQTSALLHILEAKKEVVRRQILVKNNLNRGRNYFFFGLC